MVTSSKNSNNDAQQAALSPDKRPESEGVIQPHNKQDRNFDDIAEKFAKNIYGTTKGKIRQAVVWQDIDNLLMRLPNRPLRILDAGCGEGLLACYLAEKGHHVIACDLSEEMVQRASALADEKQLTGNMTFIHCAAQDVVAQLDSPVDLIVFHAVLEWVTEQQQLLQTLVSGLNEQGALSLMFFNANGLLMRNMVLGNFQLVNPEVRRRRKRSLSPINPLQPEEVYQWLTQMGLTIEGKTGVRVFHDYLQSRQLQNKDFDTLLAHEQRYCRQEPFISLGRYIHVMAHKPRVKDEL